MDDLKVGDYVIADNKESGFNKDDDYYMGIGIITRVYFDDEYTTYTIDWLNRPQRLDVDKQQLDIGDYLEKYKFHHSRFSKISKRNVLAYMI